MFDSASAYRWADLGETLTNAKQHEGAEYCFRTAVVAGPHDPAILCRAANFYFMIGDYAATLRCLSAVLANPDLTAYYLPVFVTLSRMNRPLSTILNDGIGYSHSAAQAYLRFVAEQGRIADTETTWKWIAERSLGNDQLNAEYLDFLVRHKQSRLAAETWAQLNARHAPEYLHSNWIFNGNFKFAPRPSPFDWHIEPKDDVATDRVCDLSRTEGCALELTFNGTENLDFHGVAQQGVLTPGTWLLQGAIKIDNVTTDQGVSVRIYDPVQPAKLDIQTDSLTGTRDWTKVERLFDVRPETTLVRIEIQRRASLKFDNKISGRAWVRSLVLRRESR